MEPTSEWAESAVHVRFALTDCPAGTVSTPALEPVTFSVQFAELSTAIPVTVVPGNVKESELKTAVGETSPTSIALPPLLFTARANVDDKFERISPFPMPVVEPFVIVKLGCTTGVVSGLVITATPFNPG
jgi:hypothetical protein